MGSNDHYPVPDPDTAKHKADNLNDAIFRSVVETAAIIMRHSSDADWIGARNESMRLLRTLDYRCGIIPMPSRTSLRGAVSIRASKVMLWNGIESISDLATKKKSELLLMRNVGKKTIVEIEGLMREYGIRFKPED